MQEDIHMDNEIKELLIEIKADIKDISNRLDKVEKNQINVANAEHKNWHMLADKLNQYDLILHKMFGKKEN
jgi:transposase-like protein